MSRKEFQVTRGKIRRLGLCRHCGQPFQEGQIYVSRNSKRHRKFYHKNCWESLFYDSQDEDSETISLQIEVTN